MKPEIAALVLHHGHNASLWATAHGSQGQGPRIIVLAIASIILAVFMASITSRKKA